MRLLFVARVKSREAMKLSFISFGLSKARLFWQTWIATRTRERSRKGKLNARRRDTGHASRQQLKNDGNYCAKPNASIIVRAQLSGKFGINGQSDREGQESRSVWCRPGRSPGNDICEIDVRMISDAKLNTPETTTCKPIMVLIDLASYSVTIVLC